MLGRIRFLKFANVFVALYVSFVLLSCANTAAAPDISTSNPADTATNAVATHDPTFNRILSIYNNKSGIEWVKAMNELLHQDAVMLQWTGKQTMPMRGADRINSHLIEEAKKYPALTKEVGRVMVAGARVGGGADPYASVLVLFYKASAQHTKQKTWVWAGCDIITIQDGKIRDWRIQEDTYTKLVKRTSQIHIEREYAIIDKYWHPYTTTNELVGMSYLLDLKRTIMPTFNRGKLLLKRISPSVEQSTWEPQGILYLKGKAAVKAMFFDGLMAVLPDFYENVERTLVSGNAFIMIQNPSGTQILPHGTNHRAWYNCDIFFFNGPNIQALLFQRDTQMDIAEEKKGLKK